MYWPTYGKGGAVVPKVEVFDMEGKKEGEITLNPRIFDAEVNGALMHQAVTRYLANQRVGTAQVKTRSMVRGGGRKPWRQKGTGRARHGTIRSPIWRGGGVVFGPHNREFRKKMPKKARRQALRSALTSRQLKGDLRVLRDLSIDQPNTRAVVNLLDNLGLSGKKALIVTGDTDRSVYLSARNVPGVSVARARDLNVYEVLKHQALILTTDAVASVEEVLA